jgi:putative ABC transport system substrate-binding protein
LLSQIKKSFKRSVTWPFTALAQQAGRTYRLGCLGPSARDAPVNVAVLDELRRRGFIEGQNLTVEWRTFGLLISQYAADLVRAQPDVLYVGGGVAIRTLQHATKAIPIVGITDDMVGEGPGER